MYKAFLKHAGYTIDNDGRFHSTTDGKFVNKYPRARSLSNDELKRVNQRAVLESNYEKNYPSEAKRMAGNLRDASSSLNNAANNVRQIKLKEKKAPRADLSKLSDNELRQILNREEMERRYDSYFNTPVENKGQKFVTGLGIGLTVTAALAGIAGTAVSIYNAVDEHRDRKKNTTPGTLSLTGGAGI